MPVDDNDFATRRPTREELRHLRDLAPRVLDDADLVGSLRERKKLETRERLSWAAIRLMAEPGLDNVRVADIAEAAGVSPRTFNNYFDSREQAITAVAGDRAQRVGMALLERPADEPLSVALAEAVVEEYTHGREPDKTGAVQTRMIMACPPLRKVMFGEMATVEEKLAAAIAKRTGRDPAQDMFPRIVAAAVNGAIRVATEYWLRPETDAPYTALLRQAVRTAAGMADLPPPDAEPAENENP